jgi:hypothetical protein
MKIFQIGETVWHASAGQDQTWIICPECRGRGTLGVIMGDDSVVVIACECCSRGYEGSPGKMQTYAFRGEAIPYTITGVETRQSPDGIKVRYSVGSWSCEDTDIFGSRDEAMLRAAGMVQEHIAEETKRLKYKEKQHKTWAWHVRYYRSGIRKAKEEIARFEAKLAMVPKNHKEADMLPHTPSEDLDGIQKQTNSNHRR